MMISRNVVLLLCLLILAFTKNIEIQKRILSKTLMIGKYLDPLDLNPVTKKLKRLKYNQSNLILSQLYSQEILRIYLKEYMKVTDNSC